ncbi:MAG TPA: FecR family protein [Bdellovibrionota bacterium]|nr:FecR family protein [Bdellovibrionota bacterium]
MKRMVEFVTLTLALTMAACHSEPPPAPPTAATPPPVEPAKPGVLATVKAITGSPDTVTITAAAGSTRSGGVGTEVVQGEKIHAEAGQIVRMQVGMDSQVILPGPTNVSFDDTSTTKGSGLTLEDGQLRGLVKGNGGVYTRLRIRTKTATMGVRGTDFLVTAEASGARLQTFKGSVEMAANEEGLGAGLGVHVEDGKEARAVEASTQPVVPSDFSVKEALAALEQAHPGMESATKAASEELAAPYVSVTASAEPVSPPAKPAALNQRATLSKMPAAPPSPPPAVVPGAPTAPAAKAQAATTSTPIGTPAPAAPSAPPKASSVPTVTPRGMDRPGPPAPPHPPGE